MVIGGVVDTADKFITGVNDTGDNSLLWTVLTIPTCLDLKMKISKNSIYEYKSKVQSSKLLTKYEKMFTSKFSSFIAGVVDTTEKH